MQKFKEDFVISPGPPERNSNLSKGCRFTFTAASIPKLPLLSSIPTCRNVNRFSPFCMKLAILFSTAKPPVRYQCPCLSIVRIKTKSWLKSPTKQDVRFVENSTRNGRRTFGLFALSLRLDAVTIFRNFYGATLTKRNFYF